MHGYKWPMKCARTSESQPIAVGGRSCSECRRAGVRTPHTLPRRIRTGAAPVVVDAELRADVLLLDRVRIHMGRLWVARVERRIVHLRQIEQQAGRCRLIFWHSLSPFNICN